MMVWLLAALALPAAAQPSHTQVSPLLNGLPDFTAQADGGTQLEWGRSAGWALGEHRKLARALATLQPQRKGVVDAYVVSIALDSDPVFGREAREAGKVLARRYDATGRTIVLAGPDSPAASSLPHGSPESLSIALARIAELMDPAEDALILYTTSHGAPFGIVYADGDAGHGLISPYWLWTTLNQLKVKNRLLILSACFSGIFAPLLSSDEGVVITAAASDRTSFGCVSENDWTFFGDAMVNHALRKPQPIDRAFAEARSMVGGWEAQGRLIPSNPQIAAGAGASRWLTALDQRSPKAPTAPVGRPAAEALPEAQRRNH